MDFWHTLIPLLKWHYLRHVMMTKVDKGLKGSGKVQECRNLWTGSNIGSRIRGKFAQVFQHYSFLMFENHNIIFAIWTMLHTFLVLIFFENLLIQKVKRLQTQNDYWYCICLTLYFFLLGWFHAKPIGKNFWGFSIVGKSSITLPEYQYTM